MSWITIKIVTFLCVMNHNKNCNLTLFMVPLAPLREQKSVAQGRLEKAKVVIKGEVIGLKQN